MVYMYQAVIFDLDGTLLDTIADLAKAGNYALVEMGLPIHDIEKYKMMVGYGKQKMIDNLLPDCCKSGARVADKLFDSYYHHHMLDNTKEYLGISDVLNKLKAKKIKLGVLTNKPHNFAIKIVEHFFPGLFDIVLGMDKDSIVKPDPNILLNMIDDFKLNNSEVLYVGDSDVDILTGKNAAVDTLSVAWGFRDKKQLKAMNPTYLIDEVKQLTDIIFGR